MNELLNNVAKEKLHISHGDTQWEAGWILQREMNVTHPHWSPDGYIDLVVTVTFFSRLFHSKLSPGSFKSLHYHQSYEARGFGVP